MAGRDFNEGGVSDSELGSNNAGFWDEVKGAGEKKVDRRSFLKGVATVAGAALMASCMPESKKKSLADIAEGEGGFLLEKIPSQFVVEDSALAEHPYEGIIRDGATVMLRHVGGSSDDLKFRYSDPSFVEGALKTVPFLTPSSQRADNEGYHPGMFLPFAYAIPSDVSVSSLKVRSSVFGDPGSGEVSLDHDSNVYYMVPVVANLPGESLVANPDGTKTGDIHNVKVDLPIHLTPGARGYAGSFRWGLMQIPRQLEKDSEIRDMIFMGLVDNRSILVSPDADPGGAIANIESLYSAKE